MNPLPLNSLFSSHGIRAMKEPGQNCLPDSFIAGKLVVFLPNPNRVFLSLCLACSLSSVRLSLSRVRSPMVANQHSSQIGLLLSENQGVESVLHFDVTTLKYKLDWI